MIKTNLDLKKSHDQKSSGEKSSDQKSSKSSHDQNRLKVESIKNYLEKVKII